MADYVFKVQVFLPGNVLDTVILRQYVDPVDRCFDKFKSNLIQRYNVLTNTQFKMMWIDNDGDKISIFNEEDLRTFMELKGTKIFVEVEDAANAANLANPANPIEKRATFEPITRGPFRSCRRYGPPRVQGLIVGDGSYRPQSAQETNGNPVANSSSSPPLVLHSGVECDGCLGDIRGYRYKCIECPDFDLCFSCEMKKLHGDHMMIRIVKPLDRPFNRHFLKAMMKQRCSFRDNFEGKDKDKRARHRHSTGYTFDDIMTDIAKNISTQCTTQPSNEANNADQNPPKSNPIDPTAQFALNSETFAKAGEVLSNLAQHFVSAMDPFAVHEFAATGQTPTPTNVSGTQNETNKAAEAQKVAAENQDIDLNAVRQAVPLIPTTTTPIEPATSIPSNSSNEIVTIEDVIEQPSAPRDSSPTPDWAVVDAFGHIEDQPKNYGAIPKTSSAIPTPNSVGSVDAAQAQALPNYAVLARDLEDHLHHTLKSQASQTPQMPVHHHPSKWNKLRSAVPQFRS